MQIIFMLGYEGEGRMSFSISFTYSSFYQVEKNQSSYTGQMAPRSMWGPWKRLVLGMAHAPNTCTLGFLSFCTPRTPVGVKSHPLFPPAEVTLQWNSSP